MSLHERGMGKDQRVLEGLRKVGFVGAARECAREASTLIDCGGSHDGRQCVTWQFAAVALTTPLKPALMFTHLP